MNGIAWTIADTSEIPYHGNHDEWFVLKLAMGIVGKAKSGERIPLKLQRVIIHPFLMVASDREAAKAEINRRIDELFNALEEA